MYQRDQKEIIAPRLTLDTMSGIREVTLIRPACELRFRMFAFLFYDIAIREIRTEPPHTYDAKGLRAENAKL